MGGAQIGAGPGTFTYSPTGVNVCIAGTAVNGLTNCVANDTICIYVAQPPTANNDIANTCQAQRVSIPVLVNDVDPQGYALAITSVTNGRGTAVISANKDSVIYTANSNYSGADTRGYQYTTCEVTCPDNCSTAAIVINICHINHPPVIKGETESICKNGSGIYLSGSVSDPDGDPPNSNRTLCLHSAGERNLCAKRRQLLHIHANGRHYRYANVLCNGLR